VEKLSSNGDFSNEVKLQLTDIATLLAEIVDQKIKVEYNLVKLGEDGLEYQDAKVNVQDDSITITSPSESGLSQGGYSYLHELGYRWYFPGELWTKKPPKRKRLLELNRTFSPDFRNRRFYGGGGFAYGHPLDPEDKISKEWELWSARNRLGMEYKSKGHSWPEIIKRNRSEFTKKKQFLAIPLTNSNIESAKFCIGNRELVNLVIRDRIKKLEENISKYGPSHPISKTIGIEPSDGGGYCKCSKCLAQGSISNRVFGLANKLAKSIRNKHPDVLVSLLAYNEHAEPPTFDLEDNILVTLAPYRFQSYSSPEKMVADWSIKAKHIQVLDYWALIAYNQGKPDLGFMDAAQIKIAFWNKQNVNSAQIESTYGIGPAGIPLYMFSRLSYDLESNSEKIIDEMMVDLFGPAAKLMRTMFSRWSNEGYIAKKEAYLAFDNLSQAKKLAKDKTILLRIKNWEFYHAFLQMSEALIESKTANEKSENLNYLLNQSWAMMPTKMVHSYWVAHDYPMRFKKGFTSKGHRKRTGKANYRRIAEPKIINERPRGVSKEAEEVLTKSSANQSKILGSKTATHGLDSREIRSIQTYNLYYNAKKKGQLKFDIDLEDINKRESRQSALVSLFSENGDLLWSQVYEKTINRDLKINIPANGFYRINIKPSYVRTIVKWHNPNFTYVKAGTKMDPGKYFYSIPTGTKRVYFDKLLKGQKVNNIDGKRYKLEQDGDLFYVEIKDADGSVLWFDGWTVVDILGAESPYYPFTY